jgi:hypothetical protein
VKQELYMTFVILFKHRFVMQPLKNQPLCIVALILAKYVLIHNVVYTYPIVYDHIINVQHHAISLPHVQYRKVLEISTAVFKCIETSRWVNWP